MSKKQKLDGLTPVQAFCKEHGVTEEWLRSKGGWLYLSGTGITALPDNLTVGGSLYLSGTGITHAEEQRVKPLPADFMFTWKNGRYILADEIFSEVVSRRRNIYRVKNIAKADIKYLVTDGQGRWAHGDTLRSAYADLAYKIGDRDTSRYSGLTLGSTLTRDKAIEAYRVITGACATGTRAFVESLDKVKKSMLSARSLNLPRDGMVTASLSNSLHQQKSKFKREI